MGAQAGAENVNRGNVSLLSRHVSVTSLGCAHNAHTAQTCVHVTARVDEISQRYAGGVLRRYFRISTQRDITKPLITSQHRFGNSLRIPSHCLKIYSKIDLIPLIVLVVRHTEGLPGWAPCDMGCNVRRQPTVGGYGTISPREVLRMVRERT